MKKIAFAAFIAFWSSVATLLTTAALQPEVLAADEEESSFTLDDVAQHDSVSDCWMAIMGQVYDFTDYIPQHPVPPVIISAWCGKEATEGMTTKGYGNDHSPFAYQLMDTYRIGILATEE